MIAALSRLFSRWFSRSTVEMHHPESTSIEAEDESFQVEMSDTSAHGKLVPYDENLLERSRTQWQFGDWDSLAKLERDTLQNHPDRAKLALLAAAGKLQIGRGDEARQYVRLAQNWGVDKKHISQILIAGVHTTLGRATALGYEPNKSLRHFEEGLSIAFPGADAGLIAPALLRSHMELGLAKGHRPTMIEFGLLVGTEKYAQAARLVERCISSEDILMEADEVLADINQENNLRCLFLLKMAEVFAQKNDNLTATHYLCQGRPDFDGAPIETQSHYLQSLVRVGRIDIATDIIFQRALNGQPSIPLDEQTEKAIRRNSERVSAELKKNQEHGHALLLEWLGQNLLQLEKVDLKRVVIEIGTTRENLPGQGSTEKIARFCWDHGLDFITVDMDPRNTQMAQRLFAKENFSFTAITQKGEDYLRDYTGRMDFVFLDAYDFDHRQHSEIRQSRYVRLTGHRIEDNACHKMHLDCVESVLQKLAPDGVICIDDTWRDEHNRWTAKGTLAIPYLLGNGYTLVEARNKAALLKPATDSIRCSQA
jgi:predicted O-methyltransferase YrrM